jgi:AcrR family transcriptional regulator
MPKIVDFDERRLELADATARLIARGGLGAATMRDVATEAGLTTGSVTHYFADKRELLLFTLNASLQRRRARRDTPSLAGPAEVLRSSLLCALPVNDDRRRHWMVTIAFCALAAGDDELAAVQRTAYREFRDWVTAQLVECGSAAESAEREAEWLIAVVDGVAMQALFDHESWPAARQSAMLEQALSSIECIGFASSSGDHRREPV